MIFLADKGPVVSLALVSEPARAGLEVPFCNIPTNFCEYPRRMKLLSHVTALFVIATGLLMRTMVGHAATVVLPAELAAPLNSSTNRGFTGRSAQAPQTNVVANSVIRAIK